MGSPTFETIFEFFFERNRPRKVYNLWFIIISIIIIYHIVHQQEKVTDLTKILFVFH